MKFSSNVNVQVNVIDVTELVGEFRHGIGNCGGENVPVNLVMEITRISEIARGLS